MDPTFSAPRGVGGEYVPPSDKSITHRSLMLGALCSGTSRISRPLMTGDCVSTRRCLERLGCVFETEGSGAVVVRGVGVRGFREPRGVLDAENSGTTTRLLAGLLAGLPLFAVLTGDDSLLGRPMGRVVEPLRQMGARIEARDGGRFAPLAFLPGDGNLRPLSCSLAVPSAQVKSSLMLAALRAEGPSRIGGKIHSRDHPERMLRALGVGLETGREEIVISPAPQLSPFETTVPGDISSAAFFIAAALISGREILVKGCGVNPTRIGFLSAVKRMGAVVDVREEQSALGEPVGSIKVRGGSLSGTRIEAEEVPELIDEIPLLAVLGMFAKGVTVVRGAEELRVKESDRLAMIGRMAESLGARIELAPDGFSVEGPQKLRPGVVDPHEDHRIAMAAAVAACGIPGQVTVKGFECAAVSYPDFVADYRALGGAVA